MKKTAIAILIAVLVVAIGGGLLFAGLSAVNFQIEKLDRTEYVTESYDLTQTIETIDIESRTADVDIVPAEGDTGRVICFGNDQEKYTVVVENGRLIIRPVEGKKGWSIFSFRFKGPRITVTLPRREYELLSASLDTGDLAVNGLSFTAVNATLHTGDADITGIRAKSVAVQSNTGDMRLSDIAADTADISVHTGDLKLTGVVCTGDLRCESTTGDIRLTDVDGANVYLKASTGDITGTILTDKTFSAHTSTGDVSVPTGTTGGRCEANTSTGDIKLAISGN